jgi:hypothetical protein
MGKHLVAFRRVSYEPIIRISNAVSCMVLLLGCPKRKLSAPASSAAALASRNG